MDASIGAPMTYRDHSLSGFLGLIDARLQLAGSCELLIAPTSFAIAVYIYIYAYVYIYLVTFTHVDRDAYACNTYIRTYIPAYMHTYIHACMHACMHAYIRLTD